RLRRELGALRQRLVTKPMKRSPFAQDGRDQRVEPAQVRRPRLLPEPSHQHKSTPPPRRRITQLLRSPHRPRLARTIDAYTVFVGFNAGGPTEPSVGLPVRPAARWWCG